MPAAAQPAGPGQRLLGRPRHLVAGAWRRPRPGAPGACSPCSRSWAVPSHGAVELPAVLRAAASSATSFTCGGCAGEQPCGTRAGGRRRRRGSAARAGGRRPGAARPPRSRGRPDAVRVAQVGPGEVVGEQAGQGRRVGRLQRRGQRAEPVLDQHVAVVLDLPEVLAAPAAGSSSSGGSAADLVRGRRPPARPIFSRASRPPARVSGFLSLSTAAQGAARRAGPPGRPRPGARGGGPSVPGWPLGPGPRSGPGRPSRRPGAGPAQGQRHRPPGW